MAIFLLGSCRGRYEVVNKGVPGDNSSQLLKRLQADVLNENPDMVLIMVGTNDMINSNKFVSVEKYFDNLLNMITKIRLNKESTKILLANVLPVDEDYLFFRHDSTLYDTSPNIKLERLNEALKVFAKTNNLYFVDVNQDFINPGMTFKDFDSLLINSLNGSVNDGVHPTKEGYLKIAYRFYEAMKFHKLLKGNMKIICFGDSITYGAFMTGKGEASGDTYPGILYEFLMKTRY